MKKIKWNTKIFISTLTAVIVIFNIVYAGLIESTTTVTTPTDHTLYAKWTPIPYTVTYHANGSTAAAPTDDTVYKYEDSAEVLGGIARDGYSFSSWNTESDGEGTTYQPGAFITILDNVDLYAQWDEIPYTVTYHANGSTATAPTDDTVYKYEDSAGVLGGIARDGYSFDGWNTDPNKQGTTYQPGASLIVQDNVTLYAMWTPLSDIKVTFDSNGGNPPSFAEKTVTYDSPYGELPTVTRDGYIFDGWYTER